MSKKFYTREELKNMDILPDNYMFGNINDENFKSGRLVIDKNDLAKIAKLLSIYLYKFILEHFKKPKEVLVNA